MATSKTVPPSPSDRLVAWSTTTQPASRSSATRTFAGPIARVPEKKGAMAHDRTTGLLGSTSRRLKRREARFEG